MSNTHTSLSQLCYMWCTKVTLLIEETLLLNPLSTKIIQLLFDMHKLQYKKDNKLQYKKDNKLQYKKDNKLQYKKDNKLQYKKAFRQFHHIMLHVYNVAHLFPEDYEPIVTTTEELSQIHDCIISKARKLNLL